MDSAELAIESHKAKTRAVSQNAMRHTVALFDMQKRKLASGVLVAIEERFFVATAGHTIPSGYRNRLAILERSNLISPESSGIKHAVSLSGGPDVGLIELAADSPACTQKSPLPLSRLSIRGHGYDGFCCYVFGYPAALVEAKRTEPATMHMSYSVSGYCNLTQATWADVGPEAEPPDAAIDVFLPYKKVDEFIHYEENAYQGPPPDVHGMSGGGFWQRTKPEDGLWTAENYQLFAIQSAWDAKREYLRAVQIVHWLRLVRDQYPDLRRVLCDNFPELA